MKKYIFTLAGIFLVFNIACGREAGNWKDIKSTHFIIYYKNASGDFIRQIMGKSEDYYNKISDDLGFRRFDFWLWENRASIYIYDDAQDYQRGSGSAAWSSGSAIVKEKIIQTYPYAEGFNETILPHEIGHIIFREFVGFDNPAIPLWLEEGVASYQEKSKYAAANKIIKEAISEERFMDVGQLSAFNTMSPDSGRSISIFYAEAFSLVDYLFREFGRDRFVSFCRNLRDKKDLRQAVASDYSFKSLKELDKAWQEYLKNE